MTTQKILTSEINANSIASLPDRPCADKEYGGAGYTAREMKAAFDKLALLAINRLNSLIDDIESEEMGNVGDSIKTGIRSGHTLNDFFLDLKNGSLASYLMVGTSTLVEKLAALEQEISDIKSKME
jgi:hypothetical protein